jgi:hypothetical protein
MLIEAPYSNIPSLALCISWKTTFGQLRDILSELEEDPLVGSAVPAIGLAAHNIWTWRVVVLAQWSKK